MFEIEKHTVDQDARSWVTEMIRSQGDFRRLGSGAYGVVYGSRKSNIVYKMGEVNDNDGYLAFIKVLAKQKKHNPYLPRVYGVRFIKDKNCNEYFVVAMERLQELPGRMEDAADLLRDILVEEKGIEDAAAAQLGIKMSVPAELKTAIRVLKQAYKEASKSYADWDLHNGNFMVRGRQLVVTDPLCKRVIDTRAKRPYNTYIATRSRQ